MQLIQQVPLLATIALAGIAVFECYKFLLGRRSEFWRKVQGTIDEAQIEEINDVPVHYSAVVKYHYHIGRKAYVSRRLSFQPTKELSFEAAQALLVGLRKGGSCTVYYNPQNPSQSTLIQSVSRGNYWRMFGWCLSAVLCLVIYIKYPLIV